MDLQVDFTADVTVLVGENGSGKTNIIDAIRLITAPASGRRFYYFDAERDLTSSMPSGTPITCTQNFSDLTELEKALHIPLLVDEHENLVLTTIFDTNLSRPQRFRITRQVGDARIAKPEGEGSDRIGYVYLPPLRDAIRELDSSEGNRLAQIIQAVSSDTELDAFLSAGNRALSDLARTEAPAKAVRTVQDSLSLITHPSREQMIGLGYREQNAARLARLLRMQMADLGMDLSDISASGLGYANLLYIATVVIELERAKELDLTLILVEEPEAHLHPQLQSVLLSYLEASARKSAELAASRDEPSPAGRMQVVVSTHSPNIASAVSSANMVVVKKREIALPDDRKLSATSAISLGRVSLNRADRRKIDRYLSVTRSSLLFARQVVLVEGLAESLLIRTIAERCVFREIPSEEIGSRKCREQFQAISIIAIDSVDFEPYLKLLLPETLPLADRVVVITDGDVIEARSQGEERKAKYAQLFESHVRAGLLTIHVGTASLEADLFAELQNCNLLEKTYLTLHPNSKGKWDAMAISAPQSRPERAQHFMDALSQERQRNRIEFSKGDFAHVLSELLQDQANAATLVVPPYLEQAIRAVVMDSATPIGVEG